jgi:hypothetical protein
VARIIRGKSADDGYGNLANLKHFIVQGDEESSNVAGLSEMTIEFLVEGR